MKFAIISDIHFGEEHAHKDIIRKLSRHAMPLLQGFVDSMNSSIRPEFVVNLGDAINDMSHDIDVEHLTAVLAAFKNMQAPTSHLMGNHEQQTIDTEELKTILGLESLYYSADIGEYHLVFLFSRASAGEDSTIDEAQRAWLQKDLQGTSKQTLVFVHHALSDQDLTGNFWFEGAPNKALIRNRAEVREILERSGRVIAVFNGHVHWNRMDVQSGIPYFSITSIVENFRNDDTPSDSYAVVEVDGDSITVDVGGEDRQHYEFSIRR